MLQRAIRNLVREYRAGHPHRAVRTVWWIPFNWTGCGWGGRLFVYENDS